MTNKDFYILMEFTFNECKKIAKAKGEDYTKGSLDALANFKEGGKAIEVNAKDVCWIFMNKHYQAITNYVRTNGKSESEPISERIKDMINYLVLLQGLITEENQTTDISPDNEPIYSEVKDSLKNSSNYLEQLEDKIKNHGT